MIKIIKDGQKDFIAKCTTCGCEFSYQLVDIGLGGSVVCPCCGGYVAHNEFKGPSFVTDTRNSVSGHSTNNSKLDAPDVTITSSNAYSDSLQIIHDLCIDYDGFNTVDGLKSLIDDIRAITEQTLK